MHHMPGVAGGLPGGRTIGILDSSIYGAGVEFRKTPDQPIARGDLLTIITGGGGGYGDPFERDPERVRQDVLEGLVSPEAARDLYGVVFDATERDRHRRDPELRASRAMRTNELTSIP